MALVCGFNEFGQLNHFTNYLNKSLKVNETDGIVECLEDISILTMSWSYCFYTSGDKIYISGFVSGNNNCKKNLVFPGKGRIRQVTCCREHCVVLTDAGECWKYHLAKEEWVNLNCVMFAEDSVNVNITHISSGETQNIAITATGWIYNIPSRISFLPEITVKNVASGKEHSVILTTSGQVFSWGAGSRGQLGHGDLEPEEQPRAVEALSNHKIKSIAVGGWHTWVVTEHGELYCWGWNSNGQLACPLSECKVQTEPKFVKWPDETDAKVNKIACGSRHSVFLLNNGLVYGCGWNNYGQLLLPNSNTDIDKITKLPTSDGIIYRNIFCGPWNTAFITKQLDQ